MIVRSQPIQLDKLHALTISRGTSTGSRNLLVEVEHEGVEGSGEMAHTSIGGLPETADTAAEDIRRWAEGLESVTPWELQRVEQHLDGVGGGRAARAALDMALHDWIGKRVGEPVWRLLGLDRDRIAATSVTIGINSPEVTRERVPEILARTGCHILKIKLGSPEGMDADRAMFAAAQEAAGRKVVWRVDANGGWTPSIAREMLHWLAGRGVEFVEQPLPQGAEDQLLELFRGRPLPIFVDESVRTSPDVPPLADRADGVNLKLMKCGGLREAIRIIHTARACHLKVMIGCMSESSLAISAAAHISPLADALDLDSHLNLAPDPYSGARWEGGRVVPTDAPGLGVVPADFA